MDLYTGTTKQTVCGSQSYFLWLVQLISSQQLRVINQVSQQYAGH